MTKKITDQARAAKLAAENKVLRAKLSTAYSEAFAAGSSVTFTRIYAALDMGVDGPMWLSAKLKALRTGKKVELPAHVEEQVKREVVAHLKACGVESAVIAEYAQ